MTQDESNLIPIGDAATMLGVTQTTLRRWDENGKLRAVRKTPDGNRYYRAIDIEVFPNDLFNLAFEWASYSDDISNVPQIPSKMYSKDRAAFTARITKLEDNLQALPELSEIFSLITSAVGEIGNNSFDHNLGKWPDVPGIFFGYNIANREIVLADRGLGILETLKDVVSGLQTHEDALRIAFTQVISGRSPEKRGNGLKYVHKIIIQNPISLRFSSGSAELKIDMQDSDIDVQSSTQTLRGCIALIKF